jgi:hypothetical protein
MNEPARLIKLPTPKPEVNTDLVEHLTTLLKAALDGSLTDYASVYATDGEPFTYVKDLDVKHAAYASVVLAARVTDI